MGIYSGFTREKSDLRDKDVEITKEPFTILIMGIEDYATDGQNGRTDSLMFATVNPKTQKISLMSIPRDSRVKIVGKNKEDKINAAHAYGGEEMAIKTVEGFLKVPVDHYLKLISKALKVSLMLLAALPLTYPSISGSALTWITTKNSI